MKAYKITWKETHSATVTADNLEDAVKQAYDKEHSITEMYRHLEPIEEVGGRRVYKDTVKM